jgi:hypothetical protein
LEKCEVDSFGPKKVLEVGPHGHSNEPYGSVKGKEFDK